MTPIIPISSPSDLSSSTHPQIKAENDENALQSMAVDFEAVFIRQMLASMRTSSLGDGLFEGKGLEEFRDMQDSQLAQNMAGKGVFGIGALLTMHLENQE